MRLLRTGPQRDFVTLDIDDSTGRSQTGMRLERPFVFRFDDARGVLEGLVDIAGLLGDFALAHRRLPDVIVERCLIRERRRRIRPRHFELLGGLDRIPFFFGDDAKKPFPPHDTGARNVLDRVFVDIDRHGAGDGGSDHAAVDHARYFDVGAEILLRKDERRDVFAFDRLADNLVVLRIFGLGLARRVKRIADLAIPGERDVDIRITGGTPADVGA